MPTYLYEEPRKPPRGPEPTTLEATRRVNVHKQLPRNRVPDLGSPNYVPYRYLIHESRKKPLGPKQTPVQEGLIALVNEEMRGR